MIPEPATICLGGACVGCPAECTARLAAFEAAIAAATDVSQVSCDCGFDAARGAGAVECDVVHGDPTASLPSHSAIVVVGGGCTNFIRDQTPITPVQLTPTEQVPCAIIAAAIATDTLAQTCDIAAP